MISYVNFERARSFCCEDISRIENYELALADTIGSWEVVHRLNLVFFRFTAITDDDLKVRGLYYDRPACELVFRQIPIPRPATPKTAKQPPKKWILPKKAKQRLRRKQMLMKKNMEKNRCSSKIIEIARKLMEKTRLENERNRRISERKSKIEKNEFLFNVCGSGTYAHSFTRSSRQYYADSGECVKSDVLKTDRNFLMKPLRGEYSEFSLI